MWKSKKFIFLVVLGAAILVGSIAGVVYAQEDDEEDVAPRIALLERVADKLGIDVEQLTDAFNEAVSEIQDEARLRWIEKAVEEGWLTEEEAQEYSEWWAAKPDIEFNFDGCGQQERHSFGGFGIRGGCGFGGWYVPDSE